jgi:hypothetical protein
MRRFAIVIGFTAALVAATAAPAAAHTITPTSFDFGTFGFGQGSSAKQFAVTAEGSAIDADPQVSGSREFRTSTDTSVPSTSWCGNGNTDPGETCFFEVIFVGSTRAGSFTGQVSIDIPGSPTATVTARTSATPSKGKSKGKKCKKKGKKGAAAAKKKGCKKKGKKK